MVEIKLIQELLENVQSNVDTQSKTVTTHLPNQQDKDDTGVLVQQFMTDISKLLKDHQRKVDKQLRTIAEQVEVIEAQGGGVGQTLALFIACLIITLQIYCNLSVPSNLTLPYRSPKIG